MSACLATSPFDPQLSAEEEFTRELSVRDITRVFRLFRAISRLFRVISRLFRAITRLFRAISPHISRLFRTISRLFRDYFGLFRNNFACGCTNYFASGFPLDLAGCKNCPRSFSVVGTVTRKEVDNANVLRISFAV